MMCGVPRWIEGKLTRAYSAVLCAGCTLMCLYAVCEQHASTSPTEHSAVCRLHYDVPVAVCEQHASTSPTEHSAVCRLHYDVP
eukprot:1150982-Pelagomonas_calceolata.AAC.4